MKRKLVILNNPADFARFRKSRSYANNLIRIRVISASNQNTTRFGFIVPKKNVPSVVNRNRIKRRLKAVLHASLNQLKPADVLIFPSARLAQTDFAETKLKMIEILKQARLWV